MHTRATRQHRGGGFHVCMNATLNASSATACSLCPRLAAKPSSASHLLQRAVSPEQHWPALFVLCEGGRGHRISKVRGATAVSGNACRDSPCLPCTTAGCFATTADHLAHHTPQSSSRLPCMPQKAHTVVPTMTGATATRETRTAAALTPQDPVWHSCTPLLYSRPSIAGPPPPPPLAPVRAHPP